LPIGILFLFFPRPVGIVFDGQNKRPLAQALVVAQQEGRFVAANITNRYGLYQGFKLPRGEYYLIASSRDYHFPSQLPRPNTLTVKSFYLGEKFFVSSKYALILTHEIPVDLEPEVATQQSTAQKQENKKWWGSLRWWAMLLNALGIFWALAFLLIIFFTLIYPVWFNLLILAVFIFGLMRRLTAGKHQNNVVGKIMNAQGEPVPDVNLILRLPAFDHLVLTTRTNSNGEFKFFVNPRQVYNLICPNFVFIETNGQKEQLSLHFDDNILELLLVIKPKKQD
jgi:hypothetical protein